MDKFDVAYTAGVIDGEGCISVKKNSRSYSLTLQIVMYNRGVLEKVARTFGLPGPRVSSPRYPGGPQVWRLNIFGENAKRVLAETLPHLVEKELQARLALMYPVGTNRYVANLLEQRELQRELYFALREAKR